MMLSRTLGRSRTVFLRQTPASFSRLFSSAPASVLVLADHNNTNLGKATLSAVTAASQLGGSVTVLVAGNKCSVAAKEAAKVKGVSRVLLAESAALEHGLPENLAALLQQVQEKNKFSHIVGAANAVGKDALPRLAVKLDVQPISDVVSVKNGDTFVRPIYAGNALSTVQSKDSVKVLTVRPTAFDPAAQADAEAPLETVAADAKAEVESTWERDEVSQSERPDLTAARVVVAGGRGLGSAENFKLLDTLAQKLGAAVGASRAAVDAGYAPNELQIGQTGKVVAPELYLGFGISGAIQHLAGMKDSKVIVAVNKDAEAPIFQVADYGLVGDLFKVLPELTEKIQAA